jgi:zinc transport system ATP-binding protein
MLKPTDPLISLEGAGVCRGGRWLVRGVNLELRRGEIVTLIGPNGSGKSTTAKMALGVLPPDEGIVKRAGRLVVGYVPQRLDIDWTLPISVDRFMRLTGDVKVQQIEAALEAAGIAHLRYMQIRQLSGGELQRALLARALARKPQLLVLDEPVQGVDFAGEISLYKLIQQARDVLDCGIILVSHDLHIVMAATDRVLCLNGHVCCEGTPVAVASSAAFKQLFSKHAASELAVYEHRHDHTHLPDGRVRHADGSITDNCHSEDMHHHELAGKYDKEGGSHA